jgi:hypothetical protein
MSVPALRGSTWKLHAVGQGQGVKDTYYTYATFTTTFATNHIDMTAHGLQTGDGPVRMTTTAADLPLGYVINTDYWVIRVDADNFKVALSPALAAAGTAVTIADDGTGTHTLTVSSFFVDNTEPGNGRRFYVKNIACVSDGANTGTVEVLEGTSTAPSLARFEIGAAAGGVATLLLPVYRYVKGVYVGTQDATGAIVLVYTGR